jgi:Ca-activated chloride channel family protein
VLTLLWPWILVLLPLPLAARRFLPPRQQQLPALRVPFFARWQALAEGSGSHPRAGSARRRALLLWLLWSMLLFAAARPTWIGEPMELPNSGRDLMLAVDISGSMRVEDMQAGDRLVRRIDAVKVIAATSSVSACGDRVGLILFGSNAYLQSPLSFDVSTVQRFLSEAQIGFAGQETAIGDAMGLAVKRLRERPAESRVLVLLTDGKDTASTVDPLEAADLAAELGVRIHTIGIGAEALTGSRPARFDDRRAARQPLRGSRRGAHCMEIADRTGGQYFRARDPAELATIYDLIDTLEPLESERSLYRPQRSLLALPLGLALLASFILALLASLWLHRRWNPMAGSGA